MPPHDPVMEALRRWWHSDRPAMLDLTTLIDEERPHSIEQDDTPAIVEAGE